jgi:DNA replication protein DnaC
VERAPRHQTAQFGSNPARRSTDFDFDANPNINPATIHALATGGWIRRAEPLCLIGDSGTGKWHLLVGLATSMHLTLIPLTTRYGGSLFFDAEHIATTL